MAQRTFRHSVKQVVSIIGTAYFLLVSLILGVGVSLAMSSAEANLAQARRDMSLISYETFGSITLYGAYLIANRLQSPAPFGLAEMQRLSAEFNLDEVNFIDTNGVMTATSDEVLAAMGPVSIRNKPLGDEFLTLLKPSASGVLQKFRPGLNNPDTCRMYAGVAFPGHTGIVQVGYDQERARKDFWFFARHIVGGWTFAENGYFLFFDLNSDRIRFDTRPGSPMTGRSLSADFLLKDREHSMRDKGMFVCRMDGRLAFCMSYVDSGVGMMTVLPVMDFVRDLIVQFTCLALVLLLLFAGFAFLYLRTVRANLRVEELHAAENQRLAEDLTTAQSIQMSSLPMIFPPFPRDLTIDIFASTNPARNVGGDFYDFYYLGSHRLAVLVADVSGKGIPAAMFMMKAKTIMKSCLLSMNDLADAVNETNARLCENNDIGMFVTCWVGVLDETTGILTYVNAGHNPPYLRRADGRLDSLSDISGIFLAGMEGVQYRSFATRISAGDQLFLYTDGVTEAQDPSREMYGENRLEDVLRRGGADPRANCVALKNDVDSFTGDAAQYDDITMLALSYRGKPKTSSISRAATFETLPDFMAFAESELVAAGCPDGVKCNFLVALDEVLANVVKFSGSPVMTLQIEIAENPSVARFSVTDAGKPWNPLLHTDPDVTLRAEDRPIGGLGILMVKRLMDDVSYAYSDGNNVFRFRKAFNTPGSEGR